MKILTMSQAKLGMPVILAMWEVEIGKIMVLG
jgi:hypothetical protein